jgi:cell division septal protein FtsQ
VSARPASAGLLRRRRRLPRLSPPPRLGRVVLILLALAIVLGAVYLFWFRDSSFVRVNDVTITGATSSDAQRLRASLTSIGRSMSTLDVDREVLEQAAEGYPVVKALDVTPDFPHGLTIRVIEHDPAAFALVGGNRVPVAGDGTVLRGVTAKPGSLPEIQARDALDGDRLADARARRAAGVAGAAPLALRRRVEDVHTDADNGLVAQLRDGPEMIFGSAGQLRAKWIAAARVLADPEVEGAGYVDVRLPSRPAVGGVAYSQP